MSAAITAAGILTPVGLSLAETAASTRARLSLAQEIGWCDRRSDPYIVGVVPEDALPALHPELADIAIAPREARMLRLAHAALEQTLEAVPPGPALPVLLGLPEIHGIEPIDAGRFLERLQKQSGVAFDLPASGAAPRGRASGLLAVRRALQAIDSGAVERVLVGAVDSLLDLVVLDHLYAEGRIRGELVSDGFTPGEGACFLLLEAPAVARARARRPLANIGAAASGFEPGHLASEATYLGDGLSSAFAEVFASGAPRAPVACLYASLNGERYWARELGTARIRCASGIAPEAQIEHPAESFGDLGAAHGLALAALAVHALDNGYRAAPCLVYASSDRGERGALLIDTEPAGS